MKSGLAKRPSKTAYDDEEVAKIRLRGALRDMYDAGRMSGSHPEGWGQRQGLGVRLQSGWVHLYPR